MKIPSKYRDDPVHLTACMVFMTGMLMTCSFCENSNIDTLILAEEQPLITFENSDMSLKPLKI